MAYLYKITTFRDIRAMNSSTMIDAGASVEISQTLPVIPFPDEIQDAFMRKYGLRPYPGDCQLSMEIKLVDY